MNLETFAALAFILLHGIGLYKLALCLQTQIDP